MESIMNTEKGICYKCRRHTYTECHHCLHGTANRKIAEREGLKVWLCGDCHRLIHRCKEEDLELEREAQEIWESNFMENYPYQHHAEEAAREAFRRLFGKSYL